ncbi:class I SAM-dependent methyltransferase [Nonomuraea ferruginea]
MRWSRLDGCSASWSTARATTRCPGGQRVYVRPGERLIREAQWRRLLRRSPIVEPEDYQARMPLGEIEEFIDCTLCGEPRMQPLYEPVGEDGKWRYHVVRCPSCGFLYRNPNIRPERLGDLYAKGYSKFLTGKYAANRQRRYQLTMDAFSPVFDDGAGRRLLDFGCGAGLFLELAEQRGFDAVGVDLSPDSVAQANERLTRGRAYLGAPEDVPEIAAGGFDVITLWSVLAHLPRPVDDFRRFRELLAPGGVLMILTVNANSLLLKAYESAWSGFTKNHLMFYSADTLPVLLRRTGFAGGGLRPLLRRHDRGPHHQPAGVAAGAAAPHGAGHGRGATCCARWPSPTRRRSPAGPAPARSAACARSRLATKSAPLDLTGT